MQFNRKTFASWEFISFVLVSLGAWLLDWADTLTGNQAVLLAAASAGVYALSRGFAKSGADVKNWWETSEFFVAVIGAGQAVLAQLGGTISTSTLTFIGSGLAFALALGRGIGKNPEVAAGLETVEQATASLAPAPARSRSTPAKK